MRWSIILFLQFASFCVDATVIDEDFYDTIIQRYTLTMKTFEIELSLEKKNATKEMI